MREKFAGRPFVSPMLTERPMDRMYGPDLPMDPDVDLPAILKGHQAR